MNKAQQIVMALVAPLIVWFLGYGITSTMTKLDFVGRTVTVKWDDFERTWFVWVIALVIIGFVEYKIFSKEPQK